MYILVLNFGEKVYTQVLYVNEEKSNYLNTMQISRI